MMRVRHLMLNLKLRWVVVAGAVMVVLPFLAYPLSGHYLNEHAYWGTLAWPVANAMAWIGGALLLLGAVTYAMRELGPRPRLVPKDERPQPETGESFGELQSFRPYL